MTLVIRISGKPAEGKPLGAADNTRRALVEPDRSRDSVVEKKQITERQRVVLRGVLEGLSNKEIAAQLGVSESAIKAVIQQLFAKLQVRSRSQLVRAVLEHQPEVV